MENLSFFFDKIRKEKQRFRCYKSGDTQQMVSLEIPVHHEIGAPATKSEMKILESYFSKQDTQITKFYERANGARLFCNRNTCAIEIFSTKGLAKAQKEWKAGLSDLEEDELYDFQQGGVTFGTIPESGNYFVLFQNEVYYSDHDGGDDTSLGDFNFFLKEIVNRPAEFLEEMGSYTRYSDGKSSVQWIPKVFLSGDD